MHVHGQNNRIHTIYSMSKQAQRNVNIVTHLGIMSSLNVCLLLKNYYNFTSNSFQNTCFFFQKRLTNEESLKRWYLNERFDLYRKDWKITLNSIFMIKENNFLVVISKGD